LTTSRGNRNFLATLLRDQGHRVLEASNGREGLAAVQTEHLDLLITDVLIKTASPSLPDRMS
jgi:CheY-like chemotaxis protein